MRDSSPHAAIHRLSEHDCQTIKAAMHRDGVAPTLRQLGVGESTLRRAIAGVPVSKLAHALLEGYALRWRLDHGEPEHKDLPDEGT